MKIRLIWDLTRPSTTFRLRVTKKKWALNRIKGHITKMIKWPCPLTSKLNQKSARYFVSIRSPAILYLLSKRYIFSYILNYSYYQLFYWKKFNLSNKRCIKTPNTWQINGVMIIQDKSTMLPIFSYYQIPHIKWSPALLCLLLTNLTDSKMIIFWIVDYSKFYVI